MNNKIIVIDKEGKQITLPQWQAKYGLPIGSTKIGKHFSYLEPKFAQDIRDYGRLIVNEQLIRVADQFREDVGRPLTVNSFNRNQAKQNQLGTEGFRTASYSPHVVHEVNRRITGGFAMDINTSSDEQTNKEVVILKKSSNKLGIEIRIGFKEYQEKKQTFIHFDVGPEYYAKGKPWNNTFHPTAWERESLW